MNPKMSTEGCPVGIVVLQSFVSFLYSSSSMIIFIFITSIVGILF